MPCQRERILDNPLKLADFKKELDEKRKRKEDKKLAKAEKKAAKKASKKASKHGGGSDDEGRPQVISAPVHSMFCEMDARWKSETALITWGAAFIL